MRSISDSRKRAMMILVHKACRIYEGVMDVEIDANLGGKRTIVHARAVRYFSIQTTVSFSCVAKWHTKHIFSPFSAMALWLITQTELITQPPYPLKKRSKSAVT